MRWRLLKQKYKTEEIILADSDYKGGEISSYDEEIEKTIKNR